ncbi:procathepsin L-like [Daphnia carinata]|uniref:procathepsin L-like n=1 Tax=Daphnia carinata TaxID=120202 RepID=UPI00257E343B|nr:procathepsin L-like [Daphnia carinata]
MRPSRIRWLPPERKAKKKMKLCLIFILVVLAVALANKDKEDENLWKSYKQKFGKKHSPEKEAKRKQDFIQKQRTIEKHNRENKEWKMGNNRFTDMPEEKKKAFRGAKMIKNRVRSAEAGTVYPFLDRALPTMIDYRRHRCMSPIKVDQGECGSCWTYAAILPIEFNRCRKTGNRVSLSEQMLIDCDPYNNACNGGDYTEAWRFIKEKGGAVRSSDYPYVSGTTLKNGTCKFRSTSVAARVSSYDWTMPYPNETVSMAYLQSEGPLATSMKVPDSFYDYASGVYSDPACIGADENDVDHAVVIVGYGTTTATKTLPATRFWIVRNSWGSGWGIGGYFLIKRGVNMCNIESWTAYVRVV